MSEYLDFACGIARKAGGIAIKTYKKGFETKYKSDESGHTSPVTEADRLCEEFIIASIKEKFPGHGMISEEAGEIKGTGEYTWLIDPLDGTRNFTHRIPHFSVSVALLRKGKSICGAVYDPNMDELFFAEIGACAYLNGKRISVSGTKNMKSAIISLDGAMVPDVRKAAPAVMSKLMPEVEAVRIFGGAALGLCFCACGRLDGTVNLKCHAHDVAAGGLILMEAGGRIEDAAGKESFPFMTRYVAGTPFVEKRLAEILGA